MSKELETKASAPAEETVTITKSSLDQILSRLQRVEAAADKAQLAHFDDQHREKVGKVVRVRCLDGKVITSWSDMNKNIVEKNVNGAWYEDQSTTVTFEDNTSTEIAYAVFARRYTHVKADVISETRKGSELFLELQLEDGSVLNINSKFLN